MLRAFPLMYSLCSLLRFDHQDPSLAAEKTVFFVPIDLHYFRGHFKKGCKSVAVVDLSCVRSILHAEPACC